MVTAFTKLIISDIHRTYVALSAPCIPVTSPVTGLQQVNKNLVELSGTGVPPGLLDEVQERRSGACIGAGTAFRLVPAEIKHCPL